jgi:YbgC/YbaW family acyl-CoA thioester hydrolase|tara:strand:- start:1 stop:408 length:408 start_codon:yes stop_codon:yes gene_type:complete
MTDNLIARVKCIVDPSHIDVYGHVNNSHFPGYFEKGRIALQKLAGIEDSNLINQGYGFFVVESSYTYRKPLGENQEFEIKSRFMEKENSRFIKMNHVILSEDDEIADAITRHMCIDLKSGYGIRTPQELLQKMFP